MSSHLHLQCWSCLPNICCIVYAFSYDVSMIVTWYCQTQQCRTTEQWHCCDNSHFICVSV